MAAWSYVSLSTENPHPEATPFLFGYTEVMCLRGTAVLRTLDFRQRMENSQYPQFTLSKER